MAALHWVSQNCQVGPGLVNIVLKFCLPKIPLVHIQVAGSGVPLGSFPEEHWRQYVPVNEVWIPHQRWPERHQLDVVVYPKMSVEEAIFKGHLQYLRWTVPVLTQEHVDLACEHSTLEVILWLEVILRLRVECDYPIDKTVCARNQSLPVLRFYFPDFMSDDHWQLCLYLAARNNNLSVLRWLMNEKNGVQRRIKIKCYSSVSWEKETWELIMPFVGDDGIMVHFHQSMNDKSILHQLLRKQPQIHIGGFQFLPVGFKILHEMGRVFPPHYVSALISPSALQQWLMLFGSNYTSKMRGPLRKKFTQSKKWKLLRILDEFEAKHSLLFD